MIRPQCGWLPHYSGGSHIVERSQPQIQAGKGWEVSKFATCVVRQLLHVRTCSSRFEFATCVSILTPARAYFALSWFRSNFKVKFYVKIA